MKLRERIARWLYPSAFVRKAPVTRQRRATAMTFEPVEPSEFQAPAHPVVEETVAPPRDEYDALVQVHWGQAPLAATATKARVRMLQSVKASPETIRRVIVGEEIVIE